MKYGLPLPTASPIRSMKTIVEMMKKDPQGVKWGGGSRGSVDQIAICARSPSRGPRRQQNQYVPFQGGSGSGQLPARM